MDYIGITERVLVALRELLSVINQQMNSGNEGSFLHRALKFIQRATATLEQMEQKSKKQWNALLNVILSAARLVAQNLSSEAAFNAMFWVSREVGGLFNGRIPENMACNYDELQRLLAAASAKMTEIQESCNWLIDEVLEACENCYNCNPQTVRRLEANRLRTAIDIRDCEQTLSNAREIIEQLHGKAKEQAVKYGFGLAVAAAFTLAFGIDALKAVQAGANLRGALLGCAGVGGAVLCYLIAKKLGDYRVVWEEVNIKRYQYRQINSRLESLKAMVEMEMQAGVQLIRMPDLERAIIVLLTVIIGFGSMLVAYSLVARG